MTRRVTINSELSENLMHVHTCRFETHFVSQSLAEIDANREAFICAYDPCNL